MRGMLAWTLRSYKRYNFSSRSVLRHTQLPFGVSWYNFCQIPLCAACFLGMNQ